MKIFVLLVAAALSVICVSLARHLRVVTPPPHPYVEPEDGVDPWLRVQTVDGNWHRIG